MHVEFFMKNYYTFLSLKKFKIPDIFDLNSRIFPIKNHPFIKGKVFCSSSGPIGNTNRCLQCPHWSYNQTHGQVDMIEYWSWFKTCATLATWTSSLMQVAHFASIPLLVDAIELLSAVKSWDSVLSVHADSMQITIQDRNGRQTIFWRALSYQSVTNEANNDIYSPVICLQSPHKESRLHISRTTLIIFYFAKVTIVFHLAEWILSNLYSNRKQILEVFEFFLTPVVANCTFSHNCLYRVSCSSMADYIGHH